MADTELRADSAHDNPADADDFTASYMAAFDDWQRLDNSPAKKTSKCEMLLAKFTYAGARAAAANNVPETAAQARGRH